MNLPPSHRFLLLSALSFPICTHQITVRAMMASFLVKIIAAALPLSLCLTASASPAFPHEVLLKRQVPANATGVTTITSPNGASIRYKEPGRFRILFHFPCGYLGCCSLITGRPVFPTTRLVCIVLTIIVRQRGNLRNHSWSQQLLGLYQPQ